MRPYHSGRATRRPYIFSPLGRIRCVPTPPLGGRGAPAAAGKRYGRQRRGGTARPAAPPRLPAARALPADENEVKFPLKNRANGLTAAAAAAAPVHVA